MRAAPPAQRRAPRATARGAPHTPLRAPHTPRTSRVSSSCPETSLGRARTGSGPREGHAAAGWGATRPASGARTTSATLMSPGRAGAPVGAGSRSMAGVPGGVARSRRVWRGWRAQFDGQHGRAWLCAAAAAARALGSRRRRPPGGQSALAGPPAPGPTALARTRRRPPARPLEAPRRFNWTTVGPLRIASPHSCPPWSAPRPPARGHQPRARRARAREGTPGAFAFTRARARGAPWLAANMPGGGRAALYAARGACGVGGTFQVRNGDAHN
jgi:hypothetical protein